MDNLKQLQDKALELGLPIKVSGNPIPADQLATAINQKLTEPQKKPAQKKVEKTILELTEEEEKKAFEARVAKVKKAKKKVEKTILVQNSLAGKYLLSHTVGEVINIEAKQADVICDDNYGIEL